jgi:CRP-like cAMP-binding protein
MPHTSPTDTTLRGLDLFAGLPDDELRQLTTVLELSTARPGQRLERQDQPVRDWTLIVCGYAVIERDDTRIGLLGRGESWNEHCLLNNLRSPISVLALAPMAVLTASREEFFTLPDLHPVLAGRLVARSASSADRLALPVHNALRHMVEHGG